MGQEVKTYMVSASYIMQAIKGAGFPATKERLLEVADAKRTTLFRGREDILDNILEFFEAMPDGTTFLNMPEVTEALKAAHQGLAEGAQFVGNENVVPETEREDAPLARGKVQPNVDLASNIAKLHEADFEEPEPIARKSGLKGSRNRLFVREDDD